MAIENLTELEKALRLKEGTLKEAIESEDSSTIEIPQFTTFTEDELSQLKTNIKTEASKAAVEIAVKKAREEHGLEFQGKTMENLANALMDKVKSEASIEPNEKIDSLMKDNDMLRKSYESAINEKEELQKSFQAKEQERTINDKILSSLPSEDNLILPKSDLLTLIKANNDFGVEDTGIVVKRNGEILKDHLQNPMGIDKALEDFVKPYFKQPEGGAGGGNSRGSGGSMSIDEFTEQMTSQGVQPNSPEFNSAMQDGLKNGTLTLD
jgi:hypothetical protein